MRNNYSQLIRKATHYCRFRYPNTNQLLTELINTSSIYKNYENKAVTDHVHEVSPNRYNQTIRRRLGYQYSKWKNEKVKDVSQIRWFAILFQALFFLERNRLGEVNALVYTMGLSWFVSWQRLASASKSCCVSQFETEYRLLTASLSAAEGFS